MKIIKFDELKTRTHEAPFYAVVRNSPVDGDDRAIGCGPLALLNLNLLLKRRLGIDDGKSAYDVLMNEIFKNVQETDGLAIGLASAMEYLNRGELYNNFRTQFMNPTAMVPEVFWYLLLKNLIGGAVALLVLETPNPEKPKDAPLFQTNHMSVLHHQNGDIFLDGVKMTMNSLSNVLWYSRINTVCLYTRKA